jgi:hypothetical protein
LLGLVALLQGDYTAARTRLEESLGLSRRQEWPEPLAWGLLGLGWLEFFQRNHREARTRFEEGFTLCREIGNQPFIAYYLEGLAGVAAAQGHPAWAAQLWGAADRVRRAIKVKVPPVLEQIYEPLAASMQAHLGKEAFEARRAWGRETPLEEVFRVSR